MTLSHSQFARHSTQCGTIHDMVIENSMTGEVIERLDKCMDCLLKLRWIEPEEKIILEEDVSHPAKTD